MLKQPYKELGRSLGLLEDQTSQNFYKIENEDGNVVSLKHRPPLPAGSNPAVTVSVDPRTIVRPEELSQ